VAVKEGLKKGFYKQKDEAGFREALQGFRGRWGRVYPEIVRFWEAELEHLMPYLRYHEEIRWLIYTTNPLERFIKEVNRRVKVIEAFPFRDACAKVVYLMTHEMNEKYGKRTAPEFWLAKEALQSIRRERYGQVEADSPELR
jgi:putative transposase